MKSIAGLFFWSSISKLIVVLFTIVLIRKFSTEDYAYFIAVFMYFTVFFQLAASAIERLYIIETNKYKDNFGYNAIVLAVLLIFVPSLYFLYAKGLLYFLLINFLGFSSFLFQLLRIVHQKNEKFKDYALLELARNFLWVIGGFIILILYGSSSHLAVLFLYGVLNLLIFSISFKALPKFKGTLKSSVKYLKSKQNLINYSILAGLFPYFVFIAVEFGGSTQDIASLGAALRYQAVLALIVVSMNTVIIAQMNSDNTGLDLLRRTWSQTYLMLLFFLAVVVSIYYLIPLIDMGKYPDSKVYFIYLSLTSVVSLLALPVVNYLLKIRAYSYLLMSLSISFVLSISYVAVNFKITNNFETFNVLHLLKAMLFAYITNLALNYLFYRKFKNENTNY